jgi:hypothetical protein
MVRKSVAFTLLLMLAACIDGPDGCTLDQCMRQIDPGYGKEKPKLLPQGEPHGPQEPLNKIR